LDFVIYINYITNMNVNKLINKMNKLQELNRDDKIILCILYDEYFNPNEKKTMTPNEITSMGLYKSSSVKKTLKQLLNYGYVENVCGNYQVSTDFLYKLGDIQFKQYEEQKSMIDMLDFTKTTLERFLENKLVTRTEKEKLFDDLKETGNKNQTILYHFKKIFIDGDKKFNDYYSSLENN